MGVGSGGFVDGIVLHQILGWHHLICTTATFQAETVEALKLQNTQDGPFHAATWLRTVVGVAMIFRFARAPAQVWSGRTLLGASLAGWGVFNFIEGLINHQILGTHHVLPGHPNQLLFDLLFLASGIALMLFGWGIARREQVLEPEKGFSGEMGSPIR